MFVLRGETTRGGDNEGCGGYRGEGKVDVIVLGLLWPWSRMYEHLSISSQAPPRNRHHLQPLVHEDRVRSN
jgi:hypothetical protein